MNTYRVQAIITKARIYLCKERDIENDICDLIAFQTASASRANIQNQVEIARQFLMLAQKEVQQGRGQMILVVNAQNALVNAQKAFENNTSDYAIQVYNLLSQIGLLSVEQLTSAAAVEDQARAAAIEEYKKRVEEMQREQKTEK